MHTWIPNKEARPLAIHQEGFTPFPQASSATPYKECGRHLHCACARSRVTIHCLLVLSLHLSSCSSSRSPTRTLGRAPQKAPRLSRGLSLPTVQIVLGREVIVHVGLGLPPPHLLRQVSHVLWPQGARAPMPLRSPPLVLQDLLVECLMVNPTQVQACSRAQGITWRSHVQGLGVTGGEGSCHTGHKYHMAYKHSLSPRHTARCHLSSGAVEPAQSGLWSSGLQSSTS